MSQLTAPFQERQHLIWLELSAGRRSRVFAMAGGIDKAIAVGSSPRAHFRVDRAGVPPVQFHLERDASAIHIALAYPGDLRVNGVPVRSRCVLPNPARIEFSGIELHARLVGEAPSESESFEDVATTEHVRAYQLDQPLDAQTVRVNVPGWDAVFDGLDTHTDDLPTRAFEHEPETTEFVREPVTTAFVREPVDLPQDTMESDSLTSEWIRQSTAPLEMAALQHTLVIERPETKPVVVVADLSGLVEHTVPIPRPLPEPEPQPRPTPRPQPVLPTREPTPQPEAALFETRTFGTMLPNDARGSKSHGPAEPAALRDVDVARVVSVHAPVAVAYPSASTDQPPKTPKTDIRPAPVHRELRPEMSFEPAPAARRVHNDSNTSNTATPSRSLNDATTAFEAIAPVARVSPPAKALDATLISALPVLQPTRPARSPTLIVKLGLHAKSRPFPVIGGAVAVALLVGVCMAWTARLVAPGDTRSPAPTKQAPNPRASTSAPPATGLSTSAPPPVLSTRVAISASPSTSAIVPRPKGPKAEPSDAEISQAVRHVSAGRYAEAASAYEHVAARAGGDVYRALADLLARAGSAECKPSENRQPSCPEVLR